MGCCVSQVDQGKQKTIQLKKQAPPPLPNKFKQWEGQAQTQENQVLEQNGIRQTNIQGMLVQQSETDLNKIYLDFGEHVPGNNQDMNPASKANSGLKDAFKQINTSTVSDRSKGSSRSRKHHGTRLGVGGKVPAPSCIQVYQEVLQKLHSQQPTSSNQQASIKAIKKLAEQAKSGGAAGSEIVHIRGLSREVADINDLESLLLLRQMQQQNPGVQVAFQGEMKETTMWNPLHFAVFGGHLEVVRYLAQTFKINILKTGTRQLAGNEGEAVNNDGQYIEDHVFLLQMSLVQQRSQIFEFLLNEYSRFWPKNLYEDWFKDILFSEHFPAAFLQEAARIFFRSKTFKSIFNCMVYRKQKDWINNFIYDLESNFPERSSVKETVMTELTKQPYCGNFLMYQLFEESAMLNERLIEKAIAEVTDFDLVLYLDSEGIFDAQDYFDANKQLQLREKFDTKSLQALLFKVVNQMITLSKKYNLQEYVKQINISFLDLAKNPSTTPAQFEDACVKVKAEIGFDVWANLYVIRGADDIVKMVPGPQGGARRRVNPEDRDSLVLKLVHKSNNQYPMESDQDDSMEFDTNMQSQSTEKWNPLTYAMYNANLPLIECLLSRSEANTQRLLKIPGLFKTQEINKLFPFIAALRHGQVEMFKFFYDQLAYVYCKEETVVSLFRLLAKREQSDLVGYLTSANSTKTLFSSMSYAYRTEFIDTILGIKQDIMNEISQQVMDEQASSQSSPYGKGRQNRAVDSDSGGGGYVSSGGMDSDRPHGRRQVMDSDDEDENGKSPSANRKVDSSAVSFDVQEFLSQKKQALDHFFKPVYEALSQSPFSLQFYLSLPRLMVRQDFTSSDYHFDLLRRTLKQTSDDEIDKFLYYDTDAALQIVSDLVDKRGVGQSVNKIDNELRSLGLRIKKSSNYNLYYSAAKRVGSSVV